MILKGLVQRVGNTIYIYGIGETEEECIKDAKRTDPYYDESGDAYLDGAECIDIPKALAEHLLAGNGGCMSISEYENWWCY